MLRNDHSKSDFAMFDPNESYKVRWASDRIKANNFLILKRVR
jgi:hypothetical protein